MTKKDAYIEIKKQVAKYGRVNKYAMRAYCESKLSAYDFRRAVSSGHSIYTGDGFEVDAQKKKLFNDQENE